MSEPAARVSDRKQHRATSSRLSAVFGLSVLAGRWPAASLTARQAAQAAGLDGVEVLQADAGITDVCAGAVPAQIVVACGIFGNITGSGIQATVAALPSLCAPGALVLWTRHRSPPDLTPAIRSWFGEAGFREEAFDTSHDGFMSVAAHRLTGEPAALVLGQRLFTFPGGTELRPS